MKLFCHFYHDGQRQGTLYSLPTPLFKFKKIVNQMIDSKLRFFAVSIETKRLTFGFEVDNLKPFIFRNA